MKRFASKIFSKLVICGVIILLQFGWIVYMTYVATERNAFLNAGLHALAVILALYVANKITNPFNKLSWVFLILVFPIFGCPAYYMFGRPELTRKSRIRLKKTIEYMNQYRRDDKEQMEEIKRNAPEVYKQVSYLSSFVGFPLCREESTGYYPCGEDVFLQILEDIRNAKHYVFLEYFILAPGKMLDTIVDLLEEKAKEGVLVRLIYDDMGSISTFSTKDCRRLREKGIDCISFNPFRPILSVIMNNRDHRKILVVDGRIAYTGGFNLADEYINELPRFGYWKDAAIRITGEGAWEFTAMFLEMWNYIKREEEDCTPYLVKAQKGAERPLGQEGGSGGYVVPYEDSPLDREFVGENVYLNMIAEAREYVYIFTPYLIIGSEMVTALTNAAKCGVDVRIVTPGIPDKKAVFLVTQSNYKQLLLGGVKIYQYTPGFLHSKCFVADDKYAVVGTINLDFRSLYLHFECGAFLYKTAAVMQVKQDALETIDKSQKITLEFCKKKNPFVWLAQFILNLFSPLL